MRRRQQEAQTAIEYLLLIGASVVFTIVVTLAARDVIFPTSETIPTRAGQIASAQATFEGRPSPLPSIITYGNCIMGDPCGTENVCDLTDPNDPKTCIQARTYDSNCNCIASGNPACQTCGPPIDFGLNDTIVCPPGWVENTCQRICPMQCIGNGQCIAPPTCYCEESCSPIPPTCTITSDRNNEPGPFDSTITATFNNLNPVVMDAVLTCKPGDTHIVPLVALGADKIATWNPCSYGAIAASYQITATAGGANCFSNVNVLPPVPSCTMTVTPLEGSTQTVFDVEIQYANISPPPGSKSTLRCDPFGPGAQQLDIDPITLKAQGTCQFSTSSPPYERYIDSVYGFAPVVMCDATFIVRPEMSCTFTLSGIEPINVGPFTNTMQVRFDNLEAGVTTALMKCNATDPGAIVPIDPVSHYAFRDCSYPSVTEDTIFIVGASATGVYSTATCTQTIVDLPFPPVSSLCDVNKCDIPLKPENNPNPFLDFRVYPEYDPSPDEIRIMDSAVSCNNLGNPCKGKPDGCRVRGSRLGTSYCALIEDLTDYDWNDYIFSSNTITLSANDKLVEVTDEFCESAAANKLYVLFDFATSNYTLDMENDISSFSTSKDYLVWPNCQGYMGKVRHFFISNINNPPNLPPEWTDIPDQPSGPVFMVGQTRAFPVNGYAFDDHTVNLILGLVQFDSNKLDCWLSPIGNPNPTDVTCKALASGTSIVRVSATDDAGYYSTTQFKVKVF